MTILAADIRILKSKVISDAVSNGGRMANSPVVSGVSGNLFPNVTAAQRAAGKIDYRKAFFNNKNTFQDTLYNAYVYQETNSPGDDKIVFFPATQTDTQATITGSEKLYGTGLLKFAALAGATSIQVDVEDGTAEVFTAGDRVRVSDKATPDALAGNESYVTLTDAVYAGNVVTLTLDGAGLDVGYGINAKVSSVYEAGDVVATADAAIVTSAAGGFVDAAVQLHNEGTVLQTYTLTFTTPTDFTITGDTLGALGSGTVGAGFAVFGKDGFTDTYQITVPAAAFTGTWVAGDTIVLTTYPAAVPVWVKRVVPAGALAFGANSVNFVMGGETV